MGARQKSAGQKGASQKSTVLKNAGLNQTSEKKD